MKLPSCSALNITHETTLASAVDARVWYTPVVLKSWTAIFSKSMMLWWVICGGRIRHVSRRAEEEGKE